MIPLSVTWDGDSYLDKQDLSTADFYAQGHHGQYIYVAPAQQMVIVRFGREHGSDWWWPGLMGRIAAMN